MPGEKAAWVAALFCFFFPGSIVAESRGGVEAFLMLGIAATIWIYYKAERTQRRLCDIALGAIFGYTALIKPSVVLILPIIWLYSLHTRKSFCERRMLLSRYLLTGLIAAAVYTPWIVRNYRISGEFVPTMT